MARSLTQALRALMVLVVFASLAGGLNPPAWCQELLAPPAAKFRVQGAAERMRMTVNTSRVVEFDFDVPKMLVNNPDLVRVIPISPRSVQLSAIKQGVTQLNVWDSAGKITSIDLDITGDIQELEAVLRSEFPDAALRLRPLNSSLYVSGYVPKAEMIPQITRVAQDYFPNIVNNMAVGGVQKVLLHVKVLEVSRTKLRTLGFDWAEINGNDFITQGVSGLLSNVGATTGGPATVRFGIVDGNNQFYGFLEALRQNDLAKLLAEPTLTTLNGRPASFNVGGEVPILVPQGLGNVAVEYREFGTQVDFVPIVLGNGVVRLEVRPQITEVDNTLSVTANNVNIPGFRQRRADVGVEMKAGQTLAIAGLVYTKTESTNRGLPWLADLPWAGAAFRRVQERQNEVELVIMVTPEFAEAMDPCEVPACGPGQLTTSPTDVELYYRGYLEVPKGCANGQCGPQAGSANLGGPGGLYFGPEAGGTQANRPAAPTPGVRSAATGQRPAQPTQAATRPVASMVSPAPDNQRGGYYSSGTTTTVTTRPSTLARPALIGPAGYDELK